ncbi:MAG TPA: archaeal proteasome endopeptidase complex subunit alpha [Candidatus Eisenbacteria bacterium]|nr:archaeal proteasome endopeptidase complex subunit alpha [Candidatus Eisenbacteria bacterium]
MSVFAAPGAYDRAITVFSPDGRLFQVEYAMELVNRGATILALRSTGGVVLGAEETVDPLEEPEYSWKIFKIDEHVGAAIVGLSSDARILIDQARVHAQSNKLTYDEPIDTEVVTKRICDIKQLYTQHAGVRPFGVSMIFAGVDKTGPRVFGTHPSGTYRGYKARTEGAGRETVFNILKEEYKEDMEIESATKLAVKCLTKALEARQLPPRIKVAVIPSENKKMTVLTDEKVEGIMKQLGVGK